MVLGEREGVLRNLGGNGITIEMQNHYTREQAEKIIVRVCQFIQAYRIGPNEEMV